MARMLGRYTSRGCWTGPRHDGKPCVVPGPDCAGWERDTRAAKRREQRELELELQGELDERESRPAMPRYPLTGRRMNPGDVVEVT